LYPGPFGFFNNILESCMAGPESDTWDKKMPRAMLRRDFPEYNNIDGSWIVKWENRWIRDDGYVRM